MPPKVIVTITPGELDLGNDTNIAGTLKPDLQVITIGQFRVVVEQINKGQEAFNNRLKSIKTNTVKLLAVK